MPGWFKGMHTLSVLGCVLQISAGRQVRQRRQQARQAGELSEVAGHQPGARDQMGNAGASVPTSQAAGDRSPGWPAFIPCPPIAWNTRG